MEGQTDRHPFEMDKVALHLSFPLEFECQFNPDSALPNTQQMSAIAEPTHMKFDTHEHSVNAQLWVWFVMDESNRTWKTQGSPDQLFRFSNNFGSIGCAFHFLRLECSFVVISLTANLSMHFLSNFVLVSRVAICDSTNGKDNVGMHLTQKQSLSSNLVPQRKKGF